MNTNLIAQFEAILDSKYILTDEEGKAPYLTDWRKRYTGKALAVLLPENTAEVATSAVFSGKSTASALPV